MMHILFDFDGTLVDSFDTAIEQFNILAAEYRFRTISSDEVSQLRELSSKEIIKFLKIPFYKIPKIIIEARKRMKSEMIKLAPASGIPKVLQQISAASNSMGIITTNSEENVVTWLASHHLDQYFDFIHVESNYFGKSRVLKKVIKHHNINKQHAFYVGDETRDVDAAKKNGITAVAVTWGVNSEKILHAHQPHFIAREPSDLLKILNNFREQ